VVIAHYGIVLVCLYNSGILRGRRKAYRLQKGAATVWAYATVEGFFGVKLTEPNKKPPLRGCSYVINNGCMLTALITL
jgi:hypothetical protein